MQFLSPPPPPPYCMPPPFFHLPHQTCTIFFTPSLIRMSTRHCNLHELDLDIHVMTKSVFDRIDIWIIINIYLLFIGAGNMHQFINIVKNLIQWLWKYEYFVNLKKIACGVKKNTKIYFIYGNNINAFCSHY